MSEAERTGLDHVVLPRRRPGLALLERHRPSPADNVLDAELAAFAAPGDTVLDPWAGTGSDRAPSDRPRDARRGGRRQPVRAAGRDRLPHRARARGAGRGVRPARRLATGRRAARQHIEELYASRCATCRRPDRRRPVHLAARRRRAGSQDLPLRRRAMRRSAGPRSGWRPWTRSISPSSASSVRSARRCRSRTRPRTCRPRRSGLTGSTRHSGEERGSARRGGGPPEPPSPAADPPSGRRASSLRVDRATRARSRSRTAEGIRHSPQYLELRARFPVLDGREELVDRAARPVHAAQPVRAPRHRLEDRQRAARRREVRPPCASRWRRACCPPAG